jgi:hypothetical protein
MPKGRYKLSETMIAIGPNSYMRAVLKTLQAHRGMGITRLMFTFELTNRDQSSTGYPMWLGGRVEIRAHNGSQPYVGRLQPASPQPINLGRFGQEVTTQVTLDLTDQQFWLIDESRTGSTVRMFLTFTGYVVIEGQHLAIQDMTPLQHDINQSEWLELVRQAGLKQTMVLELETPDPMAHPELGQALDYYAQAQTRFGEGEWRLSVESIRQSLAALVGKKADDEDQESDVKDAANEARKAQNQLGYERRRELVRRAAKFMADLGAHPETDETRKPDAYAALMIAGGLLHSFTVQR